MFSLIRFDKHVDDDFILQLEDSWDWAVDDAPTLKAFVQHAHTGGDTNVSYWVSLNSIPVGFLEFCQYSEKALTKSVDLGLFIHKQYRGIGIADMLVHSSYTALKQLGLPLIATVSVENKRSLGLMRKVTNVEGELTFEHEHNRDAYVFDFEKITLSPILHDKLVVNSLLCDANILYHMFECFE